MNWKSILYSILSILLFVGVVFVIAYAFSSNILFGLLSILLLLIPAMAQRKALHEADGIIDKAIAKFIVPILCVIITLIAIAAIGFWFELFS